jgi:DNA repair exonuclease SbcCD nuclease subunit
MSNNKNSGLGRGLDSLIPSNYYDENFDANSTKSLEDMLNERESRKQNQQKEKDTNTKVKEEVHTENKKEDNQVEEKEESSKKLEVEKDETIKVSDDPLVKQHVDEVMEIVKKNPRITLWSVRSSAVFRYLRKTQPEFSISKEASKLIDEAVSQKYPEIWALFEGK